MTTAPKLTDQQAAFLLSPISDKRVRNLNGLSHLEAWDVRRQLIRVFGFEGFTIETQSLDCVAQIEIKNGDRSRWTVVYRAQVRLTVRSTDGRTLTVFEDASAGDAINQPKLGDAHDFAMKTALSQALKRCAVNLGDQFGLSLYNEGSQAPVVLRSLAYMGEPVKESEDAPVGGEPTPQGAEPDPEPTPGQGAPQRQTPAAPAAVPDPPKQQRPGAMPPAGPNERQTALDEMVAAARAIDFEASLPEQFVTAFGHPIEQGTAAEFRQARDLMTGSAAA
ncbi:Rad52/Rad22 family DNA repair protein [Streptomyces pseudovenezuelae]|uniref:Rad52/Rad22 family DNA repair protein n=1 Tax=Streptomyces pseudovenezuelae TaxID=67350 RepID=UPI002E2F53EA|nr:Rad52/Rad22 family DNA repair protein [Streptomyces pseudovenezuelae]